MYWTVIEHFSYFEAVQTLLLETVHNFNDWFYENCVNSQLHYTLFNAYNIIVFVFKTNTFVFK